VPPKIPCPLRREFGHTPLNLLPRNFCKAYADPPVSPAGEANVAQITSLAVKASVGRQMAPLGERFQAAAHALFRRRRLTLYSGLLAPGGNIPVAILVSAVLRFSARGDR